MAGAVSTYTIIYHGTEPDAHTRALLDWLASRGYTDVLVEPMTRLTVTLPVRYALAAGDEGIDVSRHNFPVDFQAAAAHGKRFAYLRASMGTPGGGYTGRDDRYALMRPAADVAGLIVGVYHYFVWDVDGAAQAENFAAAVGGHWGELPPCVDVEPRESDTPEVVDRNRATINLVAFINRLQELAPKPPVIYTSRNAWARMTLEPEWIRNYLVFVADYTPPLQLPAHAAFAWMHQYRVAEAGELPWHPGALDLDRYTGDDPPPAPPPEPAPLFRVRVIDGKVLNVRSVAGLSDPATILRQVTGGQELDVWETTRPAGWTVDWYRISRTGQEWISGSTSFTVRL